MTIDVKDALADGEVFIRDGEDIEGLEVPTLATGTRWAPDAITTPGTVYGNVTLSGGISGGDTLMGGTGSGDNLVLASTTHGTKGTVALLAVDPTYSAAPAQLFGVLSTRTITANYASQVMPVGIKFAETRVMTTAGAAGALANVGFDWAVTYKNASTVAANLASGASGTGTAAFYDRSSVVTDGATVLLGVHASFYAGPTFSALNSGTFTNGSWTGLVCTPTVDTGITMANLRGMQVSDYIGSGTVTTYRGIDIAAFSKAGTSVGIRNLSTLRQGGLATFGSDVAATYGIHMTATTGDAGSIHLAEVTTAPTNPASSAGILMYHKADTLVFSFNDAGTMRYLSIAMTGTGTTWTHSTVAI